MPKTIEALQTLLDNHGFPCELELDTIVSTSVATKNYKSPSGESSLAILAAFDTANDCLAIEALHAFDLRQATHREAALSCLLMALGRAPLVRTSLEPEGDIRLRIDCPLGPNGARDEDVLQALAVLQSFADGWYEQIAAAMQGRKFNAYVVPKLHLCLNVGGIMSAKPPVKPDTSAASPGPAMPATPAMPGDPVQAGEPGPTGHPTEPATASQAADPHTPDSQTPDSPSKPAGDAAADQQQTGERGRAAEILKKPGATPSRLLVLEAFRRWREEQDGNLGSQN